MKLNIIAFVFLLISIGSLIIGWSVFNLAKQENEAILSDKSSDLKYQNQIKELSSKEFEIRYLLALKELFDPRTQMIELANRNRICEQSYEILQSSSNKLSEFSEKVIDIISVSKNFLKASDVLKVY